jgi:hypothetical protein
LRALDRISAVYISTLRRELRMWESQGEHNKSGSGNESIGSKFLPWKPLLLVMKPFHQRIVKIFWSSIVVEHQSSIEFRRSQSHKFSLAVLVILHISQSCCPFLQPQIFYQRMFFHFSIGGPQFNAQLQESFLKSNPTRISSL